MSKMTYMAYTDYPLHESEWYKPAPTRAIELLSYDNNKYARVRYLENNQELEVKAGYIFKDDRLSKRFKRVYWYLLGGGDRKRYRPREKKTQWWIMLPESHPFSKHRFGTLQKALRVALAHARHTNALVTVYEDTHTCNSSGRAYVGWTTINVHPDGQCFKYRSRHQQTGRRFQFKG
jgi:hypothetical protein